MDNFNDAMFKTKIDNIFVKLLTCIMKEDLSDVAHFLTDNLYDMFENKINDFKRQNIRQMYDEINVKNSTVMSRKLENDKEVVEIEIISRYMDYIINRDTGDCLLGDNTKRVEKRNILTFEKKLDAKEIGMVKRCPGCGASVSVNTFGKCIYCDAVFNQADYDYILVSFQVF